MAKVIDIFVNILLVVMGAFLGIVLVGLIMYFTGNLEIYSTITFTGDVVKYTISLFDTEIYHWFV